MGTPLRVLLVEDSPDDAELAIAHVQRAGLEVDWQRVETEADYRAYLDASPDLIVSDYNVPGFGGEQALEILKASGLDIPLIIVTGTLGDEKAVDLIKQGATDYVLKENPARLGEAIRRALAEKQLRLEKAQADQALQESEDSYRDLVENSQDLICAHDLNGNLLTVNEAAVRSAGYSRETLLQMNMADLLTPATRRLFGAYLRRIGANRRARGNMLIQTASGETRIWEYDNTLRTEGVVVPVVRGMAHDITERKQAEQAEREQRLLAEALRDIAADLNSTLNLNEVFDRILGNVGRALPHDAMTIILVEGGVAHVASHSGYAERGLGEAISQVSLVVANVPNFAEMARTGRSLCVADVSNYPGWVAGKSTDWVGSSIGAPIRVDNETLGFLTLDSATPGFFRDEQASTLQAFANQAAAAIKNARLYEELENYSGILQQAVKDRTAEIENIKDRLESILNNSPDPILLLDQHGMVENANPAFYQLFRADVDEARQQSLPDLVLPSQAEDVRRSLRQVRVKSETQRLEVTARRADNTTFEADIALASIRQGKQIKGAVCVFRDITALKEVDRLKDEFVSNVSHELRTPITGLKLNWDLLNRDPQGRDRYMERLRREIDRLNALIEDLLRLSRLDQDRVDLDLKRLDLNTLAANYVDDRAPMAESKGLTLMLNALPGLPSVMADPGLLGQALSVLLTNALNYTPVGGRVAIGTRQRETQGRMWAGLSVTDTGQGIQPAEIPQLFARFFRGSVGRASGAPGTGLGLAIAKEIVERHHGRIEVDSDGVSGKGTTFTVWLPASET